MKKNTFRFLLTLSGVLTLGQSYGQQNKWYLPPYYYDMSTATPTPNSTTSDFLCAVQAIHDNAGNLLFSIKDGYLYRADGTQAFLLPAYAGQSLTFDLPFPSPSIVAVPGNCDKFYVIYPMATASLGGTVLCWIRVDMGSGSPVIDPTSLQSGPFGVSNPSILTGTSGTYTISKATSSQNERFLFAIKYGGVDKYFITPTGISLVSNLYTLPSPGNIAPSSIELSPNQQYLSFCVGNSDNKLYQIQLNGSYDAISTASVDLGYKPVGIQYDATSSYIFVSGSTGGVQWHTSSGITTGAFNTVSGSSNLRYTLLEMGKTGNIYGVNYNDRKLAYISTAAMPNPTVTTTDITINQIVISFNGGNILALPKQIDGQDYSDFGARPKPRSGFSLAGAVSNSNPALATNAYTCNDILFGNTGTPDRYILTVQSCDPSGNVVSGTGYLNYSSGLRNYTPGFLDFKALPVGASGTETWLADPAHFGYYKVTLRCTNACDEISEPTIGYLKLNAPPSAATINFQINNSQTGVPCNNKVISTACPTGIYSGSYNIGAPGTTFNTNNISSYSRKIEEVNCSTGALISLLYEDAAPVVPANPNGSSNALGLNALTINGSQGYFAQNPVMGKCYKFTLTAYNACSNASDWSYLTFDGFYRPGNGETDIENANDGQYAIDIYPNPVQNQVSVKFTLSEPTATRFDIYNLQGKLLISTNELKALTGMNIRQIDISSLTTGMYIYKLHIGSSNVVTGKISKL